MTVPNDAVRTVLAIDPGRAKCGIALVRDGSDLTVQRLIVPTADLVVTLSRMVRSNPDISVILIGSGTGSKTLVRAIKETIARVPVRLVDEVGTSLLARERYLQDNPPKGWRRFVPIGLIVPPEPYDDYAALLLAERYLFAMAEGDEVQ